MSPYIVNLTDNLISKNRYDQFVGLNLNRKEFLDYVKTDLSVGDVQDMRPETLGKIMASFQIGDVMASKEELFKGTSFAGTCGDFLRELTALCLAFAIHQRLSADRMSGVPKYKKRQTHEKAA